MDIHQLCKSPEKFLEFIKQTDGIYKDQEDFFNNLLNGLESKFQSLMDEKPVKQDDFAVPDVPRLKKEPKEKRESRATKKMMPAIDRSLNPSDTVIISRADDDTFRRSARIATKNKLIKESIQLPLYHVKCSPAKNHSTQVLSSLPSPSLPPVKIRRTNDTEPSRTNLLKQMLDETVCTADMKQPLGSSTPTDASENKENISCTTDATTKTYEPTDINEPKTPVSEFNRQIKGESVKKRVEEFEKRNQATTVNKLQLRTPERKAISTLPRNKTAKRSDATDSKGVYVENESNPPRGRTTRNNSKVLQTIGNNMKLIKEKGQEAQKKKEDIMKASAEEAKRKREERSRKVIARREAAEKEKQELARKLEKEKEEKQKLLQKQREEKLKLEQQKKKLLGNAKPESCEYAIDHVLDGASSDEEERPKNPIPPWALKEKRKEQLRIQAWIDKEKVVYPWFFDEKLKKPKLEELFSADVKMRPRTSSAFWNTKVTFDEYY